MDVEETGGAAEVKAAPAPAMQAAPAPKTAPPPAPKAAPAPAPAPSGGGGDVAAPMPGTILSINVAEGDTVKEGQTLLIFEAMKMENELFSPHAGTVKKIHVAKGAVIESGMVLVTLS